MMQTQEHNKYQDVPDGLYLQVPKCKTQDILVELIGTHFPTLPTGVVQKSMLPSV
jgi:hypothetical protein